MAVSNANDAQSPRHVLIVGAGPGIGFHFAHLAAKAGAAVTLVARKQTSLDGARDQLIATGAHTPIRTLVADAADPQALASVLGAYAENAQPPIDTALFNVSAWVPGGLVSDLVEVTRGLEAGAVSALAMAQALVPVMRELPAARLLFTGGGSADVPMTASWGLGMQKAALRNVVLALAKELADTHVSVRSLTVHGTLAPGTPFDPARVAEALWSLTGSPGADTEIAFRG
jgi:NAD(P)-dependent dehydrogenase (short-subunit alcohol dehydrogenase family)